MELNPLNQIQPAVIGSVVGIFTVTHFVLRRTFFLPVIEVMERRQARLDTASAQRDEAGRVGHDAETQTEEILTRARSRAERIAGVVRERAQAERRQRIDAVREAGASRMEAGRQQIMQEREDELASLRAETSKCVTMACQRLLGDVDPRTVDSIVARLVERRVH